MIDHKIRALRQLLLLAVSLTSGTAILGATIVVMGAIQPAMSSTLSA